MKILLYHFENIQADIEAYKNILPKKIMCFDHEEYGKLYPKLQDKRDKLLFEYLTGELTYEEMINLYTQFYNEKNLPTILKEVKRRCIKKCHLEN